MDTSARSRLIWVAAAALVVSACGSAPAVIAPAPVTQSPAPSTTLAPPTPASSSVAPPTVVPSTPTATVSAAPGPTPTPAPTAEPEAGLSSAERSALCDASKPNADGILAFDAAGVPRQVLVHHPAGFDGIRPVIVALHGYGGVATQTGSHTELSAASDKDGFVAVYPQGSGGAWGVTGGPDAGVLGATDTALFQTLLDFFTDSGCIDMNRVYVVGHSQGGGMAGTLRCAFADKVAGIAMVAGENFAPPCQPSRPTPVLMFHALDDPVLPYAGGQVARTDPGYPTVIGAEAQARSWARRDGCGANPVATPLKKGIVRLAWPNCRAPVVLYRLPTGGHDWPGSRYYEGSNRDIDADDVIWAFFSTTRS
jgi:polyhydroxybutyrate depolymerase